MDDFSSSRRIPASSTWHGASTRAQNLASKATLRVEWAVAVCLTDSKRCIAEITRIRSSVGSILAASIVSRALMVSSDRLSRITWNDVGTSRKIGGRHWALRQARSANGNAEVLVLNYSSRRRRTEVFADPNQRVIAGTVLSTQPKQCSVRADMQSARTGDHNCCSCELSISDQTSTRTLHTAPYT